MVPLPHSNNAIHSARGTALESILMPKASSHFSVFPIIKVFKTTKVALCTVDLHCFGRYDTEYKSGPSADLWHEDLPETGKQNPKHINMAINMALMKILHLVHYMFTLPEKQC